ncbi:MAG: hypothetical protein RLY86_3649 [Pseudomonadota bacterium]|jgi:hypothetical protein
MADFAALDERIRRKAHDIWEQEGRPEGRENEHWEMAAELVAQHDLSLGTLQPNPSNGGDDTAPRDQPVEPAFMAENMGDLPGLTDQGEDGPHAPMTERRREATER